jgi:hypothetical protein
MAAWPHLRRASSQAEFDQEIERLLEVVANKYCPAVLVNVRTHGRSGGVGHFPFRRSPAKEVK